MNNQWQKGTWTKSRGNSGTGTYYPRRPVKSFQDLEVYQKLLAVSVAVAKKVKSEKIAALALGLPVKIAAAHSIRFSDQLKAIQTLEEAMLDCNILIVYLEQYRDLENTGNKEQSGTIEPEFFEEQIKNLLSTRMKTLHLQMSWKKFSSLRGALATRQSPAGSPRPAPPDSR